MRLGPGGSPVTPLTEEELGRIATEHAVNDDGFCSSCWVAWPTGIRRARFPCDAARLYALVLRQSAILVSEGYSCVCEGHS